MGLLSGDNISTICVGHDITTNAVVTAYDAAGGNSLDTISAGTDLGTCNNAKDNTIFFFGNWWLSFPAPDSPMGTNSAVTGAYWVIYDPSTILVDNAPPADNSGLNGLPQSLQNIFGSMENLIITLIIIALVIGGIFAYLQYFHKK